MRRLAALRAARIATAPTAPISATSGIHTLTFYRIIGSQEDTAMMRIDAIWLATEPLDMRAGIDTALARVITVFGAAHPHCAYLFANKRANRIKLLVHDGLGIWLAARRLHQGGFVWADPSRGRQLSLSHEQLGALVLGLAWQRMGSAGIISVV